MSLLKSRVRSRILPPNQRYPSPCRPPPSSMPVWSLFECRRGSIWRYKVGHQVAPRRWRPVPLRSELVPTIALLSLPLDQCLGFLQSDLPFQQHGLQLAIQAFDVPVSWSAPRGGSHGLPGPMNNARIPSSIGQRWILRDVNSGPLSQLVCSEQNSSVSVLLWRFGVS